METGTTVNVVYTDAQSTKMIGILLAGGAASRLPNKPLLPMKDLRPVCCSGIDYIKRHGINEIVVVTPPSSVIVDVIDKLYGNHTNLEFVYQPQPTGVGDALSLVNRQGSAMIVMADNVYPEDEYLTDYDDTIDEPEVIVRRVPAWRATHLVRVGRNGFLTRTGSGTLALTTPWIVMPNNFSVPEGWPDLSGVKRKERSAVGWWDIGTADTYAAYWRS